MNYRHLIALFAGEEVDSWTPSSSEAFPVWISNGNDLVFNPLLEGHPEAGKLDAADNRIYWKTQPYIIKIWEHSHPKYCYEKRDNGEYFRASSGIYYDPSIQKLIWLAVDRGEPKDILSAFSNAYDESCALYTEVEFEL